MNETPRGFWTTGRSVIAMTVAISLAALLSNIATISRVQHSDYRFAFLAAVWTLVATGLPFWFERVFSNGAALQLAVVAWRMGTLLPAIALSTGLEGSARKCFVTTLLVCYFVALALESWLLALRARY
jgi:hypothetical protein